LLLRKGMATLVPRSRIAECAAALAARLGAPRDGEHRRSFDLVLGAAVALEAAEGALASRLVGPPGDGRAALRRGIGMHEEEGRAALEATLRTLKFTARHVRLEDGVRALQAPRAREFDETLAEQRLANGVPEGPATVLLGALPLACLPTRALRRDCCERYVAATLRLPPEGRGQHEGHFLARMLDLGAAARHGLQPKRDRAEVAQALLAALGRAAVMDPLHCLVEALASGTPAAALRDAYALSTRRAISLARDAEKAAVLLPQGRDAEGGRTRARLEALSMAVVRTPTKSPLQAAGAPEENADCRMLHDTARLLRSLVARQMRGPRYQTLPEANELAWRLLASPAFSGLALAKAEAEGRDDGAFECQLHVLDVVCSAAAGAARRPETHPAIAVRASPAEAVQVAEAQEPAVWRWLVQAHALADLLANH
jgi:hypothetical protein